MNLRLLIIVTAIAFGAQASAQDYAPPELLAPLELRYPDAAAKERVVDAIELVLYIDATGTLVRIDVATPPARPDLGFEDAARAALEWARFAPATLDGEPVPTRVPMTLDFYPPSPWVSNVYVWAQEAYANAQVPPHLSRVYEEAQERYSQTHSAELTGQLLERGTRVPLAGILVGAEHERGAVSEVYTDANGRFRLTGIAPGSYVLRIEEESFGAYETRETVGPSERVTVTYFLERTTYDAYGTDSDYVYETRQSKLRKEVTRQTLSVAEIQKIPGEGGDALKVVQNLPGVARSSFNSGQIVVRGAAPQDTLVYLDGVTIPQLYHFAGLTSVINADVLSVIDFIPGNFSARYGRAMGGILDVKTRPPKDDRLQGYVDIDVVDTALFVEGPITDGISFQASARRSYFDSVLAFVLPEDAPFDPTAAPRYWDYQARLHIKLPEGHQLEVGAYGSDDGLSVVFEEPAPTSRVFRGTLTSDILFHKGQVRWLYEGDLISNTLVFNSGYRGFGFSIGEIGFNIDVFQNTLRDELEIRALDWLTVVTGVDIEANHFNLNLKLPKSRQEGEPFGALFTSEFVELEQSEPDVQPAAFLELELTPLEDLLVIVGGRVDYSTLLASVAADIRGSARYQIVDALAVKAGVGTFHQPPRYDDLGPGVLDRRFNNATLDYQRALHVSGGLEGRLPFYEPLELEVGGFYKDLDNLLVRSDALVEREGRLVPEGLTNAGTGQVTGMEVLLRHNLAHGFFGWIAYTLSRSERFDPNFGEILFDFDQTHILTIVGSYQLPDHWQVGLRFRYTSGFPFTRRTGAVYDADADRYAPIDGTLNGDRVEAFHQLDLRVDKSFIFDSWILSLYLDVQNVYYHANPEAVSYNFDFTERSFIRGLPILPSFGIRGSF